MSLIIETVRGADFFKINKEMVFPFGGVAGLYLPCLPGAPGWNYAAVDYPAVEHGSLPGDTAFFSGSYLANYLDTLITETANYTLIGVAKTAATLAGADYPPLISTLASSGAGAGLLMFNPTEGSAPVFRIHSQANYSDGGPTDNETTDLHSPNRGQFTAFGVTVEQGVGITVFDLTNQTSFFEADTRPRVPTTTSWRVGSTYTGSSRQGSLDIAAAAIATRALMPAEVRTVYRRIKAVLATYASITV